MRLGRQPARYRLAGPSRDETTWHVSFMISENLGATVPTVLPLWLAP